MRTRRLRPVLLFAAVCLASALWEAPVHAQRYEFPPRPAQPVLDRGEMLSPTQEQRLARKLAAFEDTTSTAIVVVTVPSLDGAPIADYAVALGREWGVGQAEKDNGVVLLVSRDDREMFIATGYGVEGALPDAIANRIVEQVITPSFRQEQFYAGIDRGTDAIIQATKGEYEASETARSSSPNDDGTPTALIFTLLVLAYFVGSSFFRGGGGGKKGRRSRRRHGDMPVVIWGGGGHGGGGGGGFGGGGGGFGGFGGGSFGGGGAGGSW